MALLLTLATGAWAQDPDPIDLTPSADGTVWTLSTMPEYDVELEVTYYTDAELDQMAADEVIAKITAIGTVEYTDNSKAKIDDARAAYNALTETQQALVTNYTTLTTAETAYEDLLAAAQQAAADQAAANNVIAKINAIGTVAYTDESKALIDDARAAYNALTADQKELVTNYTTLTDAETAYDNLKAAAEQAAEEQFINGVELTKNADGSWTLAAMPAFDVELEVVYKTDLTLTVNITGWTSGSTASTPTVEGNEGNGTVTYEYKVKGATDDNYTTDVPTAAGDYTVRATVAETADYADGTATADFTIAAPEAPASTDIVVTAHQAITNGAYWATFYTTERNYQAPTGTEVYAITLSNGKLTMTQIADGIVKSGLAVVLKAKTGSLTMTKTETTGSFQGTSSLNGTLTEINGNANGNIYVLNTGSKGAGFYKLAENGTVPANKAYLVYDGAAGARDYFLFDETTAICAPLVNSEEVNSEVYDLQGRRVKTPTKGVYIVNGRKVVIK